MPFSKSFGSGLYSLNKKEFNEIALEVFKFQALNNFIYKQYLNELSVNPQDIKNVSQIPFLPISFFKNAPIKTEVWEAEQIFESSGTTGMISAKHHVRSLSFYNNHSLKLFEAAYGSVKGYHFMALLPSYLERDNSSLVSMVDHLIRKSESSFSGFYLNDLDKLVLDLSKAVATGRQVILIGVSFALLDLLEYNQVDLKGHIVMETGGMKGRRKEMIREDLHGYLCKGFNVEKIHSEYGMTELMSQAYSFGEGLYKSPATMRILIRDMYDPFDLSPNNKSGGINVIDLANINTCSFIETSDIGVIRGDYFEVLGRFDNAEIRGCNLLLS